MKNFEFKKYSTVIVIALALVLFTGSIVIYNIYFQPEEHPEVQQKDIQPTIQQRPVSASTTKACLSEYCVIEEVHPDYLKVIPHFVNPNATIVHLSSDDLKPFPEYQTLITDERKLTKQWRDGHRFIGDFIDYQCRFSDFRTLSCKYNSYPECNPQKTSLVYEYNGRYFTIGCFQNFGGGTPPTPPSK